MTFLDFFAGIGTIRIGFEQAGWTCNGHVEWDKYAQQSYNAMHEIKDGEFCGWDIRAVRADELPRSDLWTFGAPCQDFSIAGNRKGMDGERSSLVKEIFRLIRETPEENKPTWLLYENVKGMLSSNGGWDFLGIVLEMDELGFDVEWQVLNSKHFGVPQNRERVFTLGHLRGRGGRKVFPITGTGGQATENYKKAINDSKKTRELLNFDSTHRFYDISGISPCLNTMGGGGREPKIAVYGLKSQNSEQFGTNFMEELSPTLLSTKFDASVAIPVSSTDYTTKNQNGRRFKEDGDPMFTLTAQDVHGMLLAPDNWSHKAGDGTATRKHRETDIHPALVANPGSSQATYYQEPSFRIRKLTPLEYFRLQGVPDQYFYRAAYGNGIPVDLVQKLDKRTMNREEYKQYSMLTRKRLTSDSQLYKQAGNACTVNVIYEIARRLNISE